MGKTSLILFITIIILLLGIGIVKASVITPPLADDTSLVLRLSFDQQIIHKISFEDNENVAIDVNYEHSYVDTFEPYVHFYGGRTTEWATDGQYSVKAYAETETSGGYAITYVNISTNINALGISMDVKYSITTNGNNGVQIYLETDKGTINVLDLQSPSASGSDVKTIKYNFSSNTYIYKIIIKAYSYGDGNFDSATIYVDNINIITPYTKDESGHGNGEIHGANLTVGRYGYGLSFDGVNDYVEVADSQSLHFNGSDSFTITGWFKLDKLPSEKGNCEAIISKMYEFLVRADIDDRLHFFVFDGVDWEPRVSTTTTLQSNTWYFFAAVYDAGTLKMKIYLNGKLENTRTNTKSSYTTTPILIGSWGFANYFDGIIDEVRIYNRALSDQEIQSMYEALRIKFYDESTGEKIKANATIFNTNYSIQLQTDDITKEAVLFHANMPEYGEYSLIVIAENYAERHRIVQLNNDSLTEVEVYMPKISESIANIIIVNDIVGELTNYQNYIKLSFGDKTIEEQRLQYGSTPSELRANVYLLKDRSYIVTVYNEKESRCLGWISPSLDGYIYLYISQFNVPTIRGDLPVQYNITNTNESIKITYTTVYGVTNQTKVVITDKNGTVVFEQTLTTPQGVITFLKPDPNAEYIVKIEIDNSIEKISYSSLVLGSGALAIKLPQLDVGIEGFDFTTLPAWERATFFGGLCIFVALLFRRRYVPVGLSLSLALAIIFTSIGLLDLPNTLLLCLTVLVGLSYFVWWRKREVVEE